MGAIRRAWPYSLIDAGVVLAAFLLLPAQSLPDKAYEGDANLLFPYALVSLITAVLATAGALTWRAIRGRRQLRHLAVPFLLVFGIPIVLYAAGGARSRWLTGLLCAALAAALHVALELPRVHYALPAGVLAVAAFAGTAAGCQPQWRGEDFTATGLPLVVADIPGHRLTGTYADKGAIILEYDAAGSPLTATVSRHCESTVCVDLHGAYLGLTQPMPGVTVRPASATELGSYPVSWTSLPD
ncbi:hypothetical protein [Actinoplanes sp. NPDC049265]|uniref:hypothetical protein n=1 Tax=Actinoplanes sp. NPDC049265 TaxID=3363902 RepID=UPI00371DD26C